MASTSSFERKQNTDGTPNPKYVDLLEEDRPIAGQKFTCVSFVSPENILKQKGHPWEKSKAFDNSCLVGEFIVKDERKSPLYNR